jgi:hypothetical protein
MCGFGVGPELLLRCNVRLRTYKKISPVGSRLQCLLQKSPLRAAVEDPISWDMGLLHWNCTSKWSWFPWVKIAILWKKWEYVFGDIPTKLLCTFHEVGVHFPI